MRRQVRIPPTTETDGDEPFESISIKKILQSNARDILIQDNENGVWYWGLTHYITDISDEKLTKPVFTNIILDPDDEIITHGASDSLLYFKTLKGKLYTASQYYNHMMSDAESDGASSTHSDTLTQRLAERSTHNVAAGAVLRAIVIDEESVAPMEIDPVDILANNTIYRRQPAQLQPRYLANDDSSTEPESENPDWEDQDLEAEENIRGTHQNYEIDTEPVVPLDVNASILDVVSEELKHIDDRQEYKDAAMAIVASVISGVNLLINSNSSTDSNSSERKNVFENVYSAELYGMLNDSTEPYASFVDNFVDKHYFEPKFKLVCENVDRLELINDDFIAFLKKDGETTRILLIDASDLPLFYSGVGPYWVDKAPGSLASICLELHVDFAYEEIYISNSFIGFRNKNVYNFLVNGSETYYFETDLKIDFDKIFFQISHKLYIATDTDLYLYDFCTRTLSKVIADINTNGINYHTRQSNLLYFTKYIVEKNVTCLFVITDENEDGMTNIHPAVLFEGEFHDLHARKIFNEDHRMLLVSVSDSNTKPNYKMLYVEFLHETKIVQCADNFAMSVGKFCATNFKNVNFLVPTQYSNLITDIANLQEILFPRAYEYVVKANDMYFVVGANGVDIMELKKPLTTTTIRKDLIQFINIHSDSIEFDVRITKSSFSQLQNIFNLNDPNVLPSIRYIDTAPAKLSRNGRHRRSIAAYGEGVNRDFYTAAINEFYSKFLKQDGCFTIFQNLESMPTDELVDLGYFLHKWIVDMRASLPIRLPLSLIWALTVNPKTEDLEYFAKMKDNSTFQQMAKCKSDPNFMEEYGYESYEDCLKSMLKIDQTYVNSIAEGFISTFDIKNREQMNMPTVDYFISGPYVIDRKLLKKCIVADEKKNSTFLQNFTEFIMRFVDDASEVDLKKLLVNWTGASYLINGEYLNICEISDYKQDIFFRTCSNEMFVNPKLLSENIDETTIKTILIDSIGNMRDP
jgi:hypothetical protein